MPLMVAFAGWVIFRERLSFLAGVGLFLGFLGVAMIMGLRITSGADTYGLLLCVLGSVALTVATLAVRGASEGGNVIMVVGLQMIIGAASLAIVGSLTEKVYVSWSLPFILAFVYTTLVPGLAATLIWFKLVNRIGTVKAATFHFLNPFFGVVIAAFVLGESMTLLDFMGVIVITIGILAVQMSRQSNFTDG
tara:strand:+ start:76 stop:651 length:576 start_codon:yes stop_codon:yes gene_type:complete